MYKCPVKKGKIRSKDKIKKNSNFLSAYSLYEQES